MTVIASSTPGKRRLHALARREHAHLDALVVGQVLDRELAEDVVDEAGGDPDVGVVGHARGLEAHVGEHVDERLERHAVLQAVAHRDRERVHDPREGGALLRDLQEHLTRAAVFVLADRRVAVAVGDPERERLRVARARQLLAHRLLHDDVLDDPLDQLRGRVVGRLLLRGQRLADLAVVAVDRDCLDAELPRFDVELLEVLDRRLFRNIRSFADGSRQERLHRAHHLDVTHVVDGVVAHRAREHWQVLEVEARRTDDGLLHVDVVDDRSDLLVGVTRGCASARGIV